MISGDEATQLAVKVLRAMDAPTGDDDGEPIHLTLQKLSVLVGCLLALPSSASAMRKLRQETIRVITETSDKAHAAGFKVVRSESVN